MEKIEFSYVCRRRFDDLAGDDKLNRFCGSCGREVINIDLLTEGEQGEFSNLAASAGVKVCISAMLRRNALAVPQNVKASPCVTRDKPTPGAMVGQMRSGYDSTNPFSEDESDTRIKEIFAQARKRLEETIGVEQQELKKLSPREQHYLAILMSTLQPQCSPGEAIMVLRMAKEEGVNIHKIHEAAANVRPKIQSLEEMGLE